MEHYLRFQIQGWKGLWIKYFSNISEFLHVIKNWRNISEIWWVWWVVCPPFPISNWKYGRYLLHRLSENQTLEILVENSQTRMMNAFFQLSNLSTLVLLPPSIYLLILVWTQEKRWFISGAIMINLDKKYGLIPPHMIITCTSTILSYKKQNTSPSKHFPWSKKKAPKVIATWSSLR